MLIKLFILLIVALNLGLPLNNKIDFFFIGFLIFLIISISSVISIKELLFKKKYNVLIIIILTLINFFIPKLNINEAHSIFLNNKDLKIINNFIPEKIFNKLTDDYNNKFEFKRLFKSTNNYSNIENLEEKSIVEKEFAFSADSFFQKKKYSRIVNEINFSSREDLRIGQLNSLAYNLQFDKKFRRILPYYILLEIPRMAIDSMICSKGNLYYAFSDNKLNFNELSSLKFIKNNDGNCISHSNKFNNLYLIGYSINDTDNLSVKLKKNLKIKIYELISYLITFIILFLSIFSFSKINIYNLSYVYLTSFISTIIFTLIRDTNIITGLRYFRGGADGLLNYSLGSEITKNIINNNFLMALRGGENIFYFMPGLRYFNSFNNIIFGETNYGYFLLTSLIPLFLFIFFNKFLNKKYAIIILISFIFFPIFENMGLGYFNYIWQAARNHSETLSIFFIILSLTFIVDIDKKIEKINEYYYIFFTGISLAFAAILRPNFFFTTSILALYMLSVYINQKKIFKVILISFSYMVVFSCLLHNYYFGNEIVLFSNAFNSKNFPITINDFKIIIIGILNFNFYNESVVKIINHLLIWNPIYNIHRLIIIIIITIYAIKSKQTYFTYTLIICALLQHAFLFVSEPGSRYAYLAWLLTIIIFFKIIFENNLIQKIFYKKIK